MAAKLSMLMQPMQWQGFEIAALLVRFSAALPRQIKAILVGIALIYLCNVSRMEELGFQIP